MKKPTKSRREKLSVPHRCTWEDDFRKRLAGLEEPRNALRQLIQKGCLEESLLDLVYAYIVSPALVFRVQKEARERVLKGLERVVKLLDRASANMQETLDLGMLEGWNLGRLLRERALFKIPDGSARSVPAFPDFALSMGETLRLHSKHLRWLRGELRKSLSSRQVKNSLYLAELKTYVEAVSHTTLSWTVIGHLLSAARPENWPQKDVDPSLLAKNFKSFRHRNPDLYQEIQDHMTEYLSACAQVPNGTSRPGIANWKLQRKASRSPRP